MAPGVVLPTPTLPVFLSTISLSVCTASPPAIVDVEVLVTERLEIVVEPADKVPDMATVPPTAAGPETYKVVVVALVVVELLVVMPVTEEEAARKPAENVASPETL